MAGQSPELLKGRGGHRMDSICWTHFKCGFLHRMGSSVKAYFVLPEIPHQRLGRRTFLERDDVLSVLGD